jgi:hypothetical protein
MKHELEFELAAYEFQHSRSITIQSPIIEFAEDIFADGDMGIYKEIDQSAVVSQADLLRIFETTVSKLEKSLEDEGTQSYMKIANGLARLRQFDVNVFDSLMKNWVSKMQSLSNRLPLFRSFSTLISQSCLPIDNLAEVALQIPFQYQKQACVLDYNGDGILTLIFFSFRKSQLLTAVCS